MKIAFLECLYDDPYKILKVLINLYLINLKNCSLRTLNLDETLQVVKSITCDFFPFFLNEINFIFKIFDPNNIYKENILP